MSRTQEVRAVQYLAESLFKLLDNAEEGGLPIHDDKKTSNLCLK